MPNRYAPLKNLYDPGEKYLLLGNGINQVTHGFSWDDLLENVCKAAKLTTKRGQKTYSLFFEELSFTIDKKKSVEANIQYLKEIIAREAQSLKPNEFHHSLISSGYYKHFFTTNYDYSIELAIDDKCLPLKHKNDRKSGKYSLYRYNQVNDQQVWHIHGECNNGRKSDASASILIGFEHYSDYLDKIHGIIKSSNGQGLAEQIHATKNNWVHKFFTRDIDILGFGLDFTETHIWFILNFRARLIRKGVSIINTIRWIIPSFSENQDKIALLAALGVNVKPIDAEDNNYKDFLKTLSKRLSNFDLRYYLFVIGNQNLYETTRLSYYARPRFF